MFQMLLPFFVCLFVFSAQPLRAQSAKPKPGTISAPALSGKAGRDFEFVKAAARGDVRRLDTLLRQGVDIDYVFRGDYIGAGTVSGGTSALGAAADRIGNLDAVKFLVEHGANVNRHDDNYYANEWTPIEHSIWCGDTAVTRYLIHHGADVNAVGQVRETVLMVAAESDHPEIVALLLSAGANPNAHADNGDSALDEASGPQTFKVLLAHGAIAHGKYCCKALRNVISRGDTASVRLLLDHCADVNSCDESGQTPLMIACKREYEEGWQPPVPDLAMVTLLLRHGADVRAKDKRGRTALDVLKSNPFDPEFDPNGRKQDRAAGRLLRRAGERT